MEIVSVMITLNVNVLNIFSFHVKSDIRKFSGKMKNFKTGIKFCRADISKFIETVYQLGRSAFKDR